jgi:phosphoglycolate phosphatase
MLVVGFDLDMTLIDSRPGVRVSLNALSTETGVPIDVDLVLSRLGPKLEDELAEWFPLADVPAMANRYREFYWDACVDGGTLLMPGARESVDAVRDATGRVLIVTAKAEAHSRRCLEEVGIAFDEVAGWVWGDGKADALRAHDAIAYVGDTIADVQAAVSADVVAIGVTTGMHDAQQMRDAGADVVLESLTAFPTWLGAYDGS